MKPLELSAVQLRCIASPSCSDVLQSLRTLGRASAAEIAQAVRRSPATVHYHLKRLIECALVLEVERRPTARKPEGVFALAAEQLRLPASGSDSSESVYVRRAVAAGLRQTIRGYDRAARAAGEDEDCIIVLRAQIRLEPKATARFLELIEAASRYAEENRSERGRLLHWTSVVYPDVSD